MPIFEIETDQGVFEIEADREPTQAEALQAISGQIAPSAPRTPQPITLPEEQAIAQALTRQEQRPALTQALEALLAPAAAGRDIAKGIGQVAVEGGKGVMDLARKPSLGDILQTNLEIIPRAVYEAGQGIVGLVQQPEKAVALVNPVAAALTQLIQGSRTPSQAEINQAVSAQQTAQAMEEVGKEGIAPEVFGQANIPVARAAPLLIGAEQIPAAIESVVRSAPAIGREALRTAGTALTTPLSASVRAAKAAEPMLSGRALQEARRGLEAATTRGAALERDIAEAVTRENLTEQSLLSNIEQLRTEAAGSGKEALAARRALRAAESELNPQIVTAKASIEEAQTLPPVVIGKTAQEPTVFGRAVIEGIERPMAQSKAQYTKAYDAVKESLPASQPKLPAQGLFDAANTAKTELSEGFEAFNKGQIKQIIGESSRVTSSKVPVEIQNLYANANASGKADLLRSYPELASPVGKIPEYSWNELQRRFHQVNEGIDQALKYGNTGDVRTLQQLKQGIISDMETYAAQAGTDTESLFRSANKQFQAHQDKFGLNRIQTLFRDDVVQNPQLVAQKLITENNAPMVESIKSIVSPEEFAQVQAQFSRRLFSKSFDEPFDPAYFVKNFSDEASHETLRAVFGREGFNDLKRIYEASKGFDKVADFQKTIERLASESEAATKAFRGKKGKATEAQQVLDEKNRIKESLRGFKEADVADKVRNSQREIAQATQELERVRTYADLKDWARRISGLNILGVATQTPAWRQLSTYLAIHADKFDDSKPLP